MGGNVVFTPALQAPIRLTPGAGQLAVVGTSSGGGAFAAVQPHQGALAFAAAPPSLSFNNGIPVATVTISGALASVTQRNVTRVNPVIGSLTLTGQAPGVIATTTQTSSNLVYSDSVKGPNWQLDASFGGSAVGPRDQTHPQSGHTFDLLIPVNTSWQPLATNWNGPGGSGVGPYGTDLSSYVGLQFDLWTATPTDRFDMKGVYSSSAPTPTYVDSIVEVAGVTALVGSAWNTKIFIPSVILGQLGNVSAYGFFLHDHVANNMFVDNVQWVAGPFSWIYSGGQARTWNAGTASYTRDSINPFNGWVDASVNATINYAQDTSVLSVGCAATGLQNPGPVPTGALGAVGNFQLVNQGGRTNNAGVVTNPLMEQTVVFTAASGPVDHYQPIMRVNYGPDQDVGTGIPATQRYFTFTGLTNFFSASNIAQDPSPHGPATGPTTVYDFDIVAVDVLGNRGPKASQFTFWAYRGGMSGTATAGGSSTSIPDTSQNWAIDQWVGYHVFVPGMGDSIVVTNSATTLSFIPTFPLGGTPATGTQYQIGGDYFSGVGDVSFGQAAGSPAFTSAGGSPVAPHQFCLGMTHDASASDNMGIQRPSGSPASYIYGAEVGAFNFAVWNQRSPVAGSYTEFAVHHRGPPGDLAGPHTNISGASMVALGYGPVAQVNVWQPFKVPLSAVQFSTPLGGVTTCTGSITNSTMTAANVTGPGIDNGCWVTATGFPLDTFIQPSPNQSGNGTYGVAGLNVPVNGTITFTDGKIFGTNWYKGQYKVVGSFANLTWYYDDIGFTRS